MYFYANGFTQEKVLAQVKKYNTGVQSKRPGTTSCLYRAPDGNRCFVGCFLPHENTESYDVHGEAGELMRTFPRLLLQMPITDIDGLRDFQNVHDQYNSDGALSLYEHLESWLTKNVKEPV